MKLDTLEAMGSIEARLEDTRKELAGLENGRLAERAAEAEAEIKYHAEALAKCRELRPIIDAIYNRPDVVSRVNIDTMHAYSTLANGLENNLVAAKKRHAEALKRCQRLEVMRREVAGMEQHAEQRKEQIKRLQGGLISGLTRIGTKAVDPSKDLAFVIDQYRAAEYDASVICRQSAAEKRKEMLPKVEADLLRWIEENEVTHYCTRPINYTWHHGKDRGYNATLVMRAVQRTYPTSRWGIDEAARMLQVPFEPETIQKMLKGKAKYEPVTDEPERLFIDKASEKIVPMKVISGSAGMVWL